MAEPALLLLPLVIYQIALEHASVWPGIEILKPMVLSNYYVSPTRLQLVGQHLHCSHWSITAGCPGAHQRVPNQRQGHRYGDTQVPGPVLSLFFPLLASYWLDNFYPRSHWSITAGCPGARQRVPNQRHGHRYGDTQVSGSPRPRVLHHTRCKQGIFHPISLANNFFFTMFWTQI
jgi:hypothetical protein